MALIACRVRSSLRYLIATLVLASFALACHGNRLSPADQLPLVPRGLVLVIPPRDMVQGGGFHPVSAGSGAYLLTQIRPQLEARGWKVLTTESPGFTNLAVPEVEDAVAEARGRNADYVLRLILGEFLDAAPMTFRPDYVTLQSAELYSAKNGTLVWSISTPLVYSGTNFLHYQRLVDDMAAATAEQMSTAHVDPSVFTKPESEKFRARPIEPTEPKAIEPKAAAAPAAKRAGVCTTDQILSMKNTGLTDRQIKAACE